MTVLSATLCFRAVRPPCLLFARSDALLRASIGIYPMVPNHGLHAAGYNSAESEPIWVKFGTLWAKCLELAMADFERNPRSSDCLRGSWSFVFCQVNNARFHRPSSVVCRSVSRSVTLWALQKLLYSDRDVVCVDHSGGPRETPFAAARFGWILYCVHSTQYILLVC